MILGTYEEVNGQPTVKFRVAFPYPVMKVWEAITLPEQLAFWFPSKVAYDPKVGGEIQFTFDPNTHDMVGKILDYSPPFSFAYTWGGDELHFKLKTFEETDCELELINVLEAKDTAARNAAGWSVCLNELTKVLMGEPGLGPHADSADPFLPIYKTYVANGMPHGAQVPGLDV